MTKLYEDSLATIFVELADTLVEDFDVVDFMQLLVDRTVELLPVTGAGLMLGDSDHPLGLVAWTSETVRRVELFELSADEGPCRDCYRTGAPIVNIDLEKAGECWPRLAHEIKKTEFKVIHALPMRLRGTVIGSLNLFQGHTDELTPHEVKLGQALTDVATIGLLQVRAIEQRDALADQLQNALQSRVSLEQAKGALAEREGVDVDVAFSMMRKYARNHGILLSEVCQDVLQGKLDVPITG